VQGLRNALFGPDFASTEKQVPFGKLRVGSHRAFNPIRNDILGGVQAWVYGKRWSEVVNRQELHE
jgi:hypothetical protein